MAALRPMDGYAAPQLHTHAVVFNVPGKLERPDERPGRQESVWLVAVRDLCLPDGAHRRLQDLGYEILQRKHGQPEIKGYSQEYLGASSPGRDRIKSHLK